MANPPLEKPLMIFDGDCLFCRKWIARWEQVTGDRAEYAPYQDAAARFPEIPVEAFQKAVHLVEPDGRYSRAAEAVCRVLGYQPRWQFPLWLYRKVPGAAGLMEFGYRLVAEHRDVASAVSRCLWGDSVLRPTYFVTRSAFLRLLGVVYLIAFLSLWVQVDGLIGSNGILPVKDYLAAVHERLGIQSYRVLPTLLWLGDSDAALRALCGAGAMLALMSIVGVAPMLCLALLWVCYLSLSVAGQTFLGFQWDALLLEAGFLAIFLAPMEWRPRLVSAAPVARLPFWLLRWLLFRFMLMSGMVKLTAGDDSWWNLSALDFHYETQPLPTWIGWYAAHLPQRFQAFSVAAMFFIELIVPLAMFGPRRMRLAGFWALVLLQLLIGLTGNYTFFNLLTVALCVLLLDDTQWPAAFAKWRSATHSRSAPWWLSAPVAAFVVLVTPWLLYESFKPQAEIPAWVSSPYSAVAPFRSLNSYGLFRVMTKSRPEIIVEGSDDGATWLAYDFKWKPGDVMRRPGFVEPHQPRLDWQMWFAALGDYRSNPWFIQFLVRLLQGSPDALPLLRHNPFPEKPPRFVRATLYDYHFTTWDERRKSGAWWRREERGPYCPVLSLRQ